MNEHDRFWAKVDKTGDCWLWTAAQDGCGYGWFRVGRRMARAHRWAYEESVGPIPASLELDHLCRNPTCVRPTHLQPVTHRENVRRGLAGTHEAAKAHCPQGHLYDETNTRHYRGKRHCRACRRKAVRP